MMEVVINYAADLNQKLRQPHAHTTRGRIAVGAFTRDTRNVILERDLILESLSPSVCLQSTNLNK